MVQWYPSSHRTVPIPLSKGSYSKAVITAWLNSNLLDKA